MAKRPFQVAIDGPVAAGKGTVAKLVSSRLEYLYVDTGAMYRVTALQAIRSNVDPAQEDRVLELIRKSKIGLRPPTETERDGRLSTVLLNGEDVSWAIRTSQVSDAASKVAVHPKIRAYLVTLQKEIATAQDVVMEGRDITSVVLPQAQVKIFLTASEEERARRRMVQQQEKGEDITFDRALFDLRERDRRDMERDVDPLHIVPDAWVLDTSQLSIEEVVDQVVARVEQLRQQE